MTFEQTPSGQIRPHYSTTVREWRSTGGKWMIHLHRMIFGIRCSLGVADDPYGYEVSYCLGTVGLTLAVVPVMLTRILQPFEESDRSFLELFPVQTVKPMHLDAACWKRLCELAGVPAFDLVEAARMDDLFRQLSESTTQEPATQEVL